MSGARPASVRDGCPRSTRAPQVDRNPPGGPSSRLSGGEVALVNGPAQELVERGVLREKHRLRHRRRTRHRRSTGGLVQETQPGEDVHGGAARGQSTQQADEDKHASLSTPPDKAETARARDLGKIAAKNKHTEQLFASCFFGPRRRRPRSFVVLLGLVIAAVLGVREPSRQQGRNTSLLSPPPFVAITSTAARTRATPPPHQPTISRVSRRTLERGTRRVGS
eukprot:8412038-Pyramimonas_sp.AAC.2